MLSSELGSLIGSGRETEEAQGNGKEEAETQRDEFREIASKRREN